ncbi:MAG: hypothetical protein ACRD19_04290 [Terriglobia bacterium]
MEVLDCINRDAYGYFGKYLICGGTFDDLLEYAERSPGHTNETEDLRRVNQLGEAIRDVLAETTTRSGKSAALRRASLDGPDGGQGHLRDPNSLERLDELNMQGMADELRRILHACPRPDTTTGQIEEQLDAYFTREVLGKLSRIVRRISALDSLDIHGIPNERTRYYFEEAHRCYLYGFPVACAVLCRAIIESALSEAIQNHPSRRSRKSGEKVHAERGLDHLFRFIEQARELRLLTDDGRACADDVRRAGNWAIDPEDFERFKRRYGTDRIGEALANTRNVLRELYGQM